MEPGQKKPKKEVFGKLDLYALITAEGLKTADDVMTYAQRKGSVAMQVFTAKCQRRLPDLIEDAFA